MRYGQVLHWHIGLALRLVERALLSAGTEKGEVARVLCAAFPHCGAQQQLLPVALGAAFANWRDSSPPDFCFTVKVSRFITHIKRLKGCDEPVATFLARAGYLEDKLGPLLYQLPPNMKRNDAVLDSFLSLLPQGHRHVFEFRNETWLCPQVFDLLRRYNVGFCAFDMPDWTTPLLATADFAYIRFHGSAALYGSCYSDEELAEWAERIAGIARGLEAVYSYFNNDAEAFAVRNALTLTDMLAASSGSAQA